MTATSIETTSSAVVRQQMKRLNVAIRMLSKVTSLRLSQWEIWWWAKVKQSNLAL